MSKGGKRPGAGRKPNPKVSAPPDETEHLEILARRHLKTAIKSLAKIAKTGKSEAAVVSAAIALLDRGFGKPAPVKVDESPGTLPDDVPRGDQDPRIADVVEKIKRSHGLVVIAGKDTKAG